MGLNIVLVEPEIPQNTGNIARTCAATGTALHLVGPMGFSISNKWVKRAGLDYWDEVDISYYDNFSEFLEKTGALAISVGDESDENHENVSSHKRPFEVKLKDNFFMASTKSRIVYSDADLKNAREDGGDCYILFGKESYGLPEPLLAANMDNCIRIPMRENLRSLNLSNAVAIVTYEYYRQNDFNGLRNEGRLTGRDD